MSTVTEMLKSLAIMMSKLINNINLMNDAENISYHTDDQAPYEW